LVALDKLTGPILAKRSASDLLSKVLDNLTSRLQVAACQAVNVLQKGIFLDLCEVLAMLGVRICHRDGFVLMTSRQRDPFDIPSFRNISVI
jgi:hypothetical protein